MDLIRHLVFENPTTLLVLCIIATIVLGSIWRRTGSRPCRWVATACVVLGVTVGLLAWFVETDRERLQRTLETMADAADTGRAEAFIERISPAYETGSLGKDGLADIVRRGLRHVRVSAEPARIAMGNGDAVVTQAYRFRPAPGAGGVMPQAYQRIVWQGVFGPDPDGEWRLRSARAIHPREMLPQEAARHLSRLPR